MSTEQQDPQEAEYASYLQYLRREVGPDGLTEEIVTAAVAALRDVRQKVGFPTQLPDCATGPDGQVCFSWDDRFFYFEMEFKLGAPVEFFTWNREIRDSWGVDYTLGDPLPAGIPEALRRFQTPSPEAPAST